MPLSAIDPKPALVIGDLQKGISRLPTVEPFENVVKNASRLAAAFRRYGLPVVIANVDGGAQGRTDYGVFDFSVFPPDWAELAPELDPQPSDHLITKRTAGIFESTDLDEYLRTVGATQVVLSGIGTSMVVESTGRTAHAKGYNVVFALDAMTDLDAAVHENSVTKIFPQIGETATTADILAKLDETFGG